MKISIPEVNFSIVGFLDAANKYIYFILAITQFFEDLEAYLN